MPKGDPLDSSHSVLRRFDPTKANYATVDQQLDARRPTRNAFTFDDRRYGEDYRGCSVYEAEELDRLRIDRSKIVNEEQSAIAILSVKALASLTLDDLDDASPFVAIEDRFPDGEDDAQEIDASHALILRPKSVPFKSDWLGALAEVALRAPLEGAVEKTQPGLSPGR